MRLVAWRILLCAVLAVGCGEYESGIDVDYEGDLGTHVPASYGSWVPLVTATVNTGEERRLAVDTGAPATYLDTTFFPELAPGVQHADLDTMGLLFPSHQMVVQDIFAFAANDPSAVHGLLGGDILQGFVVSFDYQASDAWLTLTFVESSLPKWVGEPMPIPVAIGGGGRFAIPDGKCEKSKTCETIRLPASRILLKAIVEDSSEEVWALVDTGASAVVLDDDLYARLDTGTGERPRLDGVMVSTVDGNASAFYSRVWRLVLAGADEREGPRAGVDDVPVLVIPGSTLTDDIDAEVGVDVQVLIGGTMLRHFLTSIDYPGETLFLAPYLDSTHIPGNEFVRMGFLMEPVQGDWTVSEVNPGTDAHAEGLVVGDVVDELAGAPITGEDPSFVALLLADFGLGDEVSVGIRRADGIATRQVFIEDLLPSFPPTP
ncbi:MAG: aspartyl protease family protein [Pseudomonadota bacterium]